VKRRFSRDRLKETRAAQNTKIDSEVRAEETEVLGISSPALFSDQADKQDESDEDRGAFEADGALISLTAAPRDEGRRLDLFLAARCPNYSRAQLTRLIREGQVLLDGQPALKAGGAVLAGQNFRFPPPQAPPADLRPEPETILDVIYEDETLLIINKPWGLAVHPASGYHGPTLAGGLLARDQRLSEVGERFRPGLVHRLDKDTSGLLVVARTELALRRLAAAFSLRETRKRYLAFVRGRPAKKTGLIDSPVGRHATQRHKMAVGSGRPARTIYRLLKHFPTSGLSLLLLTLVTGRTHQARVHLQSLGTPVLADPVYSRGAADLIERFPQLAPHLQRQLLHARSLKLNHPLTGRPVVYQAPWPPDFLGLWRELLKIEEAAHKS
jgi:23S rRNA pseudouridine1911/1915/1917 synthase